MAGNPKQELDALETKLQAKLDEVTKMRDEILFNLFSVKLRKQDIVIEERLAAALGGKN